MRPKVVVLSAFATPFRSGAEACAEEVPKALKDHYDFVIISARLRRNLPKHDQLDGIPIERIGLGFPVDKWLYPFLAPFAARQHKPKIIHAVLETFAGLALHFCRWTVPSAKRLLTLQTTNRTFLKSFLIRSADRVTAISSVLVNVAKECGRNDVVQIPNGIDSAAISESLLRTPKVPGRILFVGRLEKVKGVDTLLRALVRVAPPNSPAPQYSLRIAGNGSERRMLEEYAAFVFSERDVKFLGYIKPPELYDEYAKAEIFCALSRSEALGNVFIEAQAAGCAVIGTNVGGIPDIVKHRESGLLVLPNDIKAAADALRTLLCDKGLREKLAERGKKNAENYDWVLIARQYASVYSALL